VVHDLFVLTHPEWYSRSYVRTHAPVLATQLRSASRFVAVSEPVAAEVRHRYPRTPVTVAPNAPSDVFRKPSPEALPEEVRAAIEAPGVEGYFFAVGSRDPRKNFGRLASAHASLPPALRTAFPLLIAGGESSVFASDSFRPVPDVRSIGYVDDAALAALYAAATAVIVPSLDEGFGLPLVETLAAGGRLAVSDIPAFRWVAGDAPRYFDPHSVADMGAVLRSVAQRPPPAVDAAMILARFNWNTTADIVADFTAAFR
jgi:glycosyltransferase involved in cell wall biosynthesis